MFIRLTLVQSSAFDHDSIRTFIKKLLTSLTSTVGLGPL